jgi:hypothetical protein
MQKHFTKYAKELYKGFHAQVLGSHKWAKMVEEIKVGTLVLVMSDNEKRYNWPLGLVTEVHRSQDGVVRAAAVRTKCMEGQRPTTVSRNVRELIPLTMFDNTEECQALGKPENNTTNSTKDEHISSEHITDETATVAASGEPTDKELAAKYPRSAGTAAVESKTPSTTKVKEGRHPRAGRHHHERPPPWAEAQNAPKSYQATRSEAAVSQISQMLFPNDEDTINQQQRPQEVESTKCEILDNNESKTKLIDEAQSKEPQSHQKMPHTTTIGQLISGNDTEALGKSTKNNTEVPEAGNQDIDKNTHKTPTLEDNKQRKSGNTTQEKDNNGELPETPGGKTDKLIEKKPEINNHTAKATTETPEWHDANKANWALKTPKRKYKTEVEKLRELQNGLKVSTTGRGDVVAVVQETKSNQCESNETKEDGDSPKTGLDA